MGGINHQNWVVYDIAITTLVNLVQPEVSCDDRSSKSSFPSLLQGPPKSGASSLELSSDESSRDTRGQQQHLRCSYGGTCAGVTKIAMENHNVLEEKSTIVMAIFNSYAKLPEGI